MKTWKCECGIVMNGSYKFCNECGSKKPEEKEKIKLRRFEAESLDDSIVFTISHGNTYVTGIHAIHSLKSFRNGYFELNDGTKSKVPYLWKSKKDCSLYVMIGGEYLKIGSVNDFESLYPVAVWLEE